MKKILLIEDDPLLIDIYSTKLKEALFDVAIVDDGEKVLHTIEEFIPDCVILDIVLPHKDGWDVLSSIKKDDRFKNIKVIILSNLGQKEEIEKGKMLGADMYLIKAHYTPSQVVEEIQKVFAV